MAAEPYEMGAVFESAPGARVSALSFHREGAYCVSCATDGFLSLIDATEGMLKKQVRCGKYGLGATVYTHHDQSVLHCDASRDGGFPGGDPCAVRYLSLHDNKYLRFYVGHSARVCALAMNPLGDTFISACEAGDVVLWDLAAPAPVAKLELFADVALRRDCGRLSPPAVAISPDALVFAVCASSAIRGVIKMYDTRNYKGGPFATFEVAQPSGRAGTHADVRWTGAEFSPEGDLLLISTNGPAHLIVDAFTGETKAALHDHAGMSNEVLAVSQRADGTSAAFSTDGKKVASGSFDGALRIYDVEGHPASPPMTLEGHSAPACLVKYSPKYDIVASACAHTALWLPSDGEGE